MDANTIRFLIFIAVFALMLILEAFIPRHPIVDSKLRRVGINLTLTGVNILLVKLVFGAAAIGAARFAEDRGWGLFNYLEWPDGREVFPGSYYPDNSTTDLLRQCFDWATVFRARTQPVRVTTQGHCVAQTSVPDIEYYFIIVGDLEFYFLVFRARVRQTISIRRSIEKLCYFVAHTY